MYRRERNQSDIPNDNIVAVAVRRLVFVVIQAKGFDTHWIPLLPPLVMLASAAGQHTDAV